MSSKLGLQTGPVFLGPSLGTLGGQKHEVTELEREGHRREAASAGHLGVEGSNCYVMTGQEGASSMHDRYQKTTTRLDIWGTTQTGVLLLF